MKYPQSLKKGDKIVLTALSCGVSRKDIERKKRYLKAIDNLETFPNSQYKDALTSLAKAMVHRQK